MLLVVGTSTKMMPIAQDIAMYGKVDIHFLPLCGFLYI